MNPMNTKIVINTIPLRAVQNKTNLIGMEAPPLGLEPRTCGLTVRCSNLLS